MAGLKCALENVFNVLSGSVSGQKGEVRFW